MAQLFTPRMIEKALSKPGGEAQLRKAYSELRKVANKRLQRLEEQDLGTYGSYRYPKLNEVADQDVPGLLADVSRYIRDPRHTVRGEKQFLDKEIAELHKRGYDFINRSNIYDFFSYMEDMRQRYGSKVFDSGSVADAYNEAQRLRLPTNVLKKNFEAFMGQMDQIEKLKTTKGKKNITWSKLNQRLANYTRRTDVGVYYR